MANRNVGKSTRRAQLVFIVLCVSAGWLALGAAAVIAIMIFGHTHWLN